MANYNRLTLPVRRLIADKLNRGASYRSIGEDLEIEHTTVSREVKRNKVPATREVARLGRIGTRTVKILGGTHLYDPEAAQAKADKRRTANRKPRKLVPGTPLFQEVGARLARGHKPDAVAGRLKLEHPDQRSWWVSHESIYQCAYRHKEHRWFEYLKKGRTQRKTRTERTTPWADARVSIHARPEGANTRAVAGHLEADTVIGAHRAGAKVITTITCRATRLMDARISVDKTAAAATASLTEMITHLGHVRTVTVDNGSEFTGHHRITQATGVPFYFADPYSSCQRGTNERHNGLLRQFIPKGTDLDTITTQELAEIVAFWNNYPRKILGYQTPQEAWDQHTS